MRNKLATSSVFGTRCTLRISAILFPLSVSVLITFCSLHMSSRERSPMWASELRDFGGKDSYMVEAHHILRQNGLAGKENACLMVMNMAKNRFFEPDALGMAKVMDPIPFSEEDYRAVNSIRNTFLPLYDTNPSVRRYFDELYADSLAEAEQEEQERRARRAGFDSLEEYQAHQKRERFLGARNQILLGIHTLKNMQMNNDQILETVRTWLKQDT